MVGVHRFGRLVLNGEEHKYDCCAALIDCGGTVAIITNVITQYWDAMITHLLHFPDIFLGTSNTGA